MLKDPAQRQGGGRRFFSGPSSANARPSGRQGEGHTMLTALHPAPPPPPPGPPPPTRTCRDERDSRRSDIEHLATSLVGKVNECVGALDDGEPPTAPPPWPPSCPAGHTVAPRLPRLPTFLYSARGPATKPHTHAEPVPTHPQGIHRTAHACLACPAACWWSPSPRSPPLTPFPPIPPQPAHRT